MASRSSRAWEALQDRLSQTVETVTRSSRIDIVSGGIDEIDPPEDLDEFAEQAKTTGPVRKNLRQFINDVWEPGYRVEAGSETTEAYFMGGENAPEGTPEGGFLANSFVYAGERNVDFYDGGKETTWQRWVRGTILIEKLKDDVEDPKSPITGFYHIRPETVYAQVENNSNILLDPEPDTLPSDIDEGDYDQTRRGEVAAYIQFDDESILGLRRNGFDDQQQIPLSQNDVMKQTLEPDIGDNAGLSNEQGVFGTSIIEGISEDIAEYKQIKRDRAEAIKRKAYSIWTAQFTPETIEAGNRTEIIEWTDDEIESTEQELINMGPGDILTSDANIDLEEFDGDIPNVDGIIDQYINIILSPLPAPKYMVGFAEDINRDITSEQNTGYQDLVSEERRYQEKKWTPVLQEVARRQGLPDAASVQLKLEPETEENPIKSLSAEEIDKMNTYISTLATAAGPQAGPTALVDREELLDVMDFPADAATAQEEIQSITEEVSDEETEAAWYDIMGVESLQGQYEAGSWVSTPDGDAMVDDRVTEGTVDGMEASSDSPVYAVAMLDEAEVNFYRADELEETDGPNVDVDEPTEDLEAMHDITVATGGYEALQFGDFDYPESWEDAATPARIILMDAWSSMGGQFDCGGTCCKGTMLESGMAGRASDQFCASMKDAALGTHAWRGGWAD